MYSHLFRSLHKNNLLVHSPDDPVFDYYYSTVTNSLIV